MVYGVCMARPRTLADTIRDAIRRDGRTRYRLCLESGVNQAVLGRFVRGQRGLTLDTADRLCKVLGLELRPTTTRQKRR